jgi:hypothetical protein
MRALRWSARGGERRACCRDVERSCDRFPAPASIVVPAGTRSESAPLATLPVAASTPVVISATRNGVTRSTTVTVQPPPVTIASLSITPSSLVGTNSTIGTVTLTDAAPAGGVEVELRSSDPDIAAVSTALTIAAGATSGTFAIATSVVTVTRAIIITASHATTEKTAEITVLPPAGNYVASVTVTPSFIIGGSTAVGTVTLATASDKKNDVTLTSNSAVLAIPAIVTVKQHDTSADFTVLSTATAAPTAVTIAAAFGGVTQLTRVVVGPANAVTLASFTITPSRVAGGASASGIVTLTSAAPSGGAAVTIDPRRRNIVSVPATVTVPEGATRYTQADDLGLFAVSISTFMRMRTRRVKLTFTPRQRSMCARQANAHIKRWRLTRRPTLAMFTVPAIRAQKEFDSNCIAPAVARESVEWRIALEDCCSAWMSSLT